MIIKETILILIMMSSLSISQAQPTVELQKFTGGDGYYDYGFGASSSISGNFAIVGAPSEYNNDIKCGAAYIYYFNGTSWIEQIKLLASDSEENAYFGNSVYISGNYAIVGSVGSNDYGYQSGAAYIFHFDGTSWIEKAKIFPSDPAESDRFGESVCISGNFAIVGASKDDDNATNSGSAYIFHNNGTSWVQQAKLSASNAAEDDRFGNSVSISGSYAVVGAYFNDTYGFNAGAAYIYYFDGTFWSEQAQLIPSETNSNQYFGKSVSISGNYAIVGSIGDDVMGNNAGAAYIYYFDGFFWTEQAKLYASDAYGYDNFGESVNISGDYAIVGSVGNDDNGTNSGSAYVFVRNEMTWSEHVKFTASDGSTYSQFGISAGISGDFAIVGAYDPVYQTDICAAYVFGPPIPIFLTQPEDHIGICVGDNISFSVSGEYFETFQWQVDEGSGFQDITNGGVYNNATTETLEISNIVPDMDNFQFRCQVSNSFNTVISDTAVLILDTEDLNFFCVNDTTIKLDEGQMFYTISGTEFDPTVIDDNCGNASLENNFTNTTTLAGAQIPIGATEIEWILSDNESNSETCSHNITVIAYVGINLIDYHYITISPNPTNGIMYLGFTKNNIKYIRIFDVKGKIIFEKSDIQQNELIDLSSFKNGFYIINIQTEKENILRKIIKISM
ncbi:MAG: T9SS type A sorting domain-containing protein [Chlorobi bacterium]|nr:T9SS type A sorting domain-containing protein [Chlorobiota bacterium]